jgi:hypothetical protein
MSFLDNTARVATLVTALSALIVTGMVVRRELAPVTGNAAYAAHTSRSIPDSKSIASTGHRIGATTPVLTLIEFGDYECPACTAFAGIVRGAVRRHPQEIAMVFTHWPLP